MHIMPASQNACSLAISTSTDLNNHTGFSDGRIFWSNRPVNIALIDNYDSYTHNLAHLLASVNHNVLPTTILSDKFSSLHHLLSAFPVSFDAFVLSPGPGNPTKSTDFSPLQRQILSSHFPVFAVCLGHQALCHAYGAKIMPLPFIPAHGVISNIILTSAAQDCPIFRSVPSTFQAVRYHSLHAVTPASAFKLKLTACVNHPDSHIMPHSISQPVIMAVSHPCRPHFGVQFHPESVASQYGHKIISNFIKLASRLRIAASPAPNLLLSSAIPSCAHFPTARKYKSLVKDLPSFAFKHSPPQLFERLFSHLPAPFWLDSSTAEQSPLGCKSLPPSLSQPIKNSGTRHPARFSIMGACAGPLSELITYDVNNRIVSVSKAEHIRSHQTNSTRYHLSIFEYLKQQLQLRRASVPPDLPCQMNGGYVGYMGYEVKQDVRGTRKNHHISQLPDAWFVFADRIMILDHAKNRSYLVALVQEHVPSQEILAREWFKQMIARISDIQNDRECLERANENHVGNTRKHLSSHMLTFFPQRRRSEYLADIESALVAIKEGESYEVCLTNRLTASVPKNTPIDHLGLYRSLRSINKAPYSAFLRMSDREAICCTSPEKFLSINCEGWVESRPIKGTRPRGRSHIDDEKLKLDLQQSAKDRSENLMIVDLVRNDLNRTCHVGTVTVPKLMYIESYATVHQLVSDVIGCLSRESDVIDCIQSAYPMGSMTGAPKIRTMEIIDNLEHSSRGVYSGTIGYFAVSGAADLNVVIRSAVVVDSSVTVGVGGAIVAMSNPSEEYDECILKGQAIMQAVALHVTGRSDGFCIAHEAQSLPVD